MKTPPQNQAVLPESLREGESCLNAIKAELDGGKALVEDRGETVKLLEESTATEERILADPAALKNPRLRAALLEARQTKELAPYRIQLLDERLAEWRQRADAQVRPFVVALNSHVAGLGPILYDKLKSYLGKIVPEEDLQAAAVAALHTLKPWRMLCELHHDINNTGTPENALLLWDRVLELTAMVDRFGTPPTTQ